ncbi:MAG: Rieske 2Fe-2S domain-containing protein [Betaproteobacteria bacterium]|nr:Rieske 2Fe-2S domain-containing protein [Betaproteobacteria bacterium]
MAALERLICASGELEDSKRGVRFEVRTARETMPAFAVRFEGRVHAYLNRCAHVSMELDWRPGEFFDAEGLVLICSTHGALYAPDTGECLGGPCSGGLQKLAVVERAGRIYLEEDNHG